MKINCKRKIAEGTAHLQQVNCMTIKKNLHLADIAIWYSTW